MILFITLVSAGHHVRFDDDPLVPGSLDLTDQALLYASQQGSDVGSDSFSSDLSVEYSPPAEPAVVERRRAHALLAAIDGALAVRTRPLNASATAYLVSRMGSVTRSLWRVIDVLVDTE